MTARICTYSILVIYKSKQKKTSRAHSEVRLERYNNNLRTEKLLLIQAPFTQRHTIKAIKYQAQKRQLESV